MVTVVIWKELKWEKGKKTGIEQYDLYSESFSCRKKAEDWGREKAQKEKGFFTVLDDNPSHYLAEMDW